MDRAAAVAQMRFDYIEDVCSETVIKPKESKERIRSRKIDQFLTGKYTGIPAFIGIMGIVFWLTFNVIGAFLQGILESGITLLTDATDAAMQAANISGVLHSLVIDGIFSGVGGVLSFLPIIVTLFFLPVFAGGQRLHGQSSVHYGQAVKKTGTFRKKHCSNADWIWMYGSRRYGKPDAAV